MIKRNSKGQFVKKYIPWNKGLKLGSNPEHSIRMKGMFRGDKNPAWKGGKITDKNGYVFILKPNHPFVNNKNYIRRSRLVIEQLIGRYLKPKEVVHHEGETNDDRPETLILFPSQRDHAKYHRYQRLINFNI